MTPLLNDVTVNGEVIPAARIAAEAQNHPAPAGKPGIAWMAAARALTIRALLLQEARARGLSASPEEIAPGQRETEEEALVRQLLDQAIVAPDIGTAQLQAEYAAHPDRFRAPTLYEASHILLTVASPDEDAPAQQRAAQILAELAANPARFADLARGNSACSSAQNGGRLGQISAGDTVPEFEAALDRLSEGEIAPAPVRSRFGYHLIRLDARATGEVLPFERVEGPLRAAMAKRAWAEAARRFIDGLVQDASVSGITLQAA